MKRSSGVLRLVAIHSHRCLHRPAGPQSCGECAKNSSMVEGSAGQFADPMARIITGPLSGFNKALTRFRRENAEVHLHSQRCHASTLGPQLATVPPAARPLPPPASGRATHPHMPRYTKPPKPSRAVLRFFGITMTSHTMDSPPSYSLCGPTLRGARFIAGHGPWSSPSRASNGRSDALDPEAVKEIPNCVIPIQFIAF